MPRPAGSGVPAAWMDRGAANWGSSMSRYAAVTTAALHGVRPRSPRARILLLLLAAVMLVGGLAALPPNRVDASSNETMALVPPGGGTAGVPDLGLAGSTYGGVSAALAGGDTFEVPLDIPGFAAIGPFVFVANADLGTNSIFFATQNSVQLSAGPLAGLPVRLALLADWDDGSDSDPTMAMSVRVESTSLSALFPAFGPIPGMSDGLVPLSEAVLIFSASGAFTLDPAQLPALANDFLGVGGPLARPLSLTSVATLLAVLDEASNAELARAARLLGMDPSTDLVLSGPLAATAAFLSDAGAAINQSDFSLGAPIVVDSAELPAWLSNQLPGFNLAFSGGQPSARVSGTAQVETAGITNDFAYDVSVAQAATYSVSLSSVDSVETPYGLAAFGWDGDLDDATLSLVFNEPANQFRGTLDASANIGGVSAGVHVAINADPSAATAIVAIDGQIPLGNVASWLGGSSLQSPNMASSSTSAEQCWKASN